MRTLLQFLHQARQTHLQFISGTLPSSPIYVIGNPSADLDSIVSAIVYAYCANNHLPTQTPRPHIPLLNLPHIPAGPELHRQRPEFVTALSLSLSINTPAEQFQDTAGLGDVLTITDFARSLRDNNDASVKRKLFADATMVDWNAMPHRWHDTPGQGSLNGLENVQFRTLACIDHHVDESFVPRAENLPANQPRIIQPGPGSCASLVTNEMERRGFWTKDVEGVAEELMMVQVAKLALAAVLIDTSNLTAESKVTSADIRAVEFLRRLIDSYHSPEPKWDMDSFYTQIYQAKQNSLDLLTFTEILDRDFKDWTESPLHRSRVKLGFCSCVKSIRWMVRQAGGIQPFLDSVRSFAEGTDKKLDVVIVMTAFTSRQNGRFCRELLICVVGEKNSAAVEGVRTFVQQAAEQLGLVEWVSLDGDVANPSEEDVRSALNGDEPFWRRLWVQNNVAASRKQVAPLLRDAVARL